MNSQWVLYSPFLNAYLAIDADGEMAAVSSFQKAARWKEKPGVRWFLGVHWKAAEVGDSES